MDSADPNAICNRSQDIYEYCGWRQCGGVINLAPLSAGRGDISPTVVPHFEPKGIYMFGINPAAPSMNMRFTVGAITVGGRTQTANFVPRPNGLQGELLSDVYNRSDQPVIVNGWAIFSTPGLGSPLAFALFNLNPIPIRVFICLWGNTISECTAKELRAEERREQIE